MLQHCPDISENGKPFKFEWRGVAVDEKAGTQEDLNFTICSISDPNLSGQGNDSCGTFAIYGTVCGDDVQFRKKYEESYGAAVYHGKLITNRDQAAIVGKWQLKADSSVCGPFQLTRGEVSQNERLRSRSPPRLVQQNMFKQLQAQSSAWLPSADHYEIVSLFKQIHSKVAQMPDSMQLALSASVVFRQCAQNCFQVLPTGYSLSTQHPMFSLIPSVPRNSN